MQTEHVGACVAKNIDNLSVRVFVGFQIEPSRVSQAAQGSQTKPARTLPARAGQGGCLYVGFMWGSCGMGDAHFLTTTIPAVREKSPLIL